MQHAHLFNNVWPKFLGLNDAKVKGSNDRAGGPI